MVSYNISTKCIEIDYGNGNVSSEILEYSFLEWLQLKLGSYNQRGSSVEASFYNPRTGETGSTFVPFDFTAGFVGYFGYEMKFETLPLTSNIPKSANPDASFLFLDRVIVFDHIQDCFWLVELTRDSKPTEWMDEMQSAILNLEIVESIETFSDTIQANLRHSRTEYLENIHECIENIIQGESYELCLTTQLELKSTTVENLVKRSFPVYKHLRKRNPAPYAAYIWFNEGFAVASSSPERFLKISNDSTITMKPIKVCSC